MLLCVVLLFALTLLATALATDHGFQLRVESNQEMAERARDQSMRALSEGEHWLRDWPGHSRPVPCASECTAEQVLWKQLAVPSDLAQHGLSWWQRHAQKAAPTHHLLPAGLTLEGRGYWLISEIDVPPEHLETLEQPETPETPEPTIAYYRIAAELPDTVRRTLKLSARATGGTATGREDLERARQLRKSPRCSGRGRS